MLTEALDEADGGARACLEAIEKLVFKYIEKTKLF